MSYPYYLDYQVQSKQITNIDNDASLIEEANITLFFEKIYDAFNDLFMTETSLKNTLKAQQKAVENQERFLQEKGIDTNELRRRLAKEGDLGDAVTFRNVMMESLRDLKYTKFNTETLTLIVVVLFLFILHTALISFLSIFFGPIIGSLLVAIFVAPFSEEAMKRYSVDKRMTIQGFLLFNIAEMSTYILHLVSGGTSVFAALLIRLLPLIGHAVNTYIHKKADMEEEILKRRGITDINIKDAATKVAVFTHIGWNIFPVLGSIAGYMLSSEITKHNIKRKINKKYM